MTYRHSGDGNATAKDGVAIAERGDSENPRFLRALMSDSSASVFGPLGCETLPVIEQPASPQNSLKDLGPDERPRERLIEHGPASLSDAEVLAVLIGSGVRGEGVLELSRRVLAQVGGLAGLARADTLALGRIRGIGPARAAVLSAAIESGRRAAGTVPPDRIQLSNPDAVFSFLSPRLRSRPTEALVVLSLDARGRLIAPPHTIAGGVRAVGARPADVLREPLVLRAVSTLIAHNHPSGDPTPSPHDVALTETIIQAGRLLDLHLLDHLVIGDGSYVSMRREALGFPG